MNPSIEEANLHVTRDSIACLQLSNARHSSIQSLKNLNASSAKSNIKIELKL